MSIGRPLFGCCFLLFLSLFLSLLCCTTNTQAAFSIPSEVVIGALLPFSSSLSTFQRLAIESQVALTLAASHVNTQALGVGLPVPLRIVCVDAFDELSSLKQMWALFHNETNLIAFVGGFDNRLAAPQALLATQLDKLFFVIGGRSPFLIDDTTFPTTILQTYSSSSLGLMVSQQSLLNRWYRFAYITTDDDEAQGFINSVLNFVNVSQVTDDGLSVDFFPYQIPSAQDMDSRSQYFSERDAHFDLDSVIDQILDDVIENNIWINLAHGVATTRILHRAYLRGMLAPPYLWVYDNCRQVQEYFASFPGEPLYGSICLDAKDPNFNHTGDAFFAQLHAASPTVFAKQDTLVYEHVAVYNSVLAFTLGVLGQFNLTSMTPLPTASWDGTTLAQTITAALFYGAAGTLIAYQPTGEAAVDMGVYNWDPTSKKLVVRAYVDIITQSLVAVTEFVWPDSSANTPKDRPRVYVSGDELYFSRDSTSIVLGYLITSLGAWTSLILLEQAVAFRHRRGPGHVVFLRCAFWLTLSAFAASVCCLWPALFFLLNGYDVDYITIAYPKTTLSVSCLIFFGGTLVAWSLVLLDMKKEQVEKRKEAHLQLAGKKDDPLRGSRLGSSSDSNDDSSNPSHPANHVSTQQSGQQNGTGSGTFMSRLKRMKDAFDGDISHMAASFSPAIVVAAIVMTVAIIGAWDYISDHLRMSATYKLSIASFIGSAVFLFFFSIVTLLIYFHAWVGDIRGVGPFMLSGVVTGGAQIAFRQGKFVYDRTIDGSISSSDWRANTECTVILMCLVVTLCIILMIINVSALSISKAALDKVVDKMIGQIMILERNILRGKEEMEEIRNEGLHYRRMLELTNLCRPVFRNYAVAIAMADPANDKQMLHTHKLITESESEAVHKSTDTTNNLGAAATGTKESSTPVHGTPTKTPTKRASARIPRESSRSTQPILAGQVKASTSVDTGNNPTIEVASASQEIGLNNDKTRSRRNSSQNFKNSGLALAPLTAGSSKRASMENRTTPFHAETDAPNPSVKSAMGKQGTSSLLKVSGTEKEANVRGSVISNPSPNNLHPPSAPSTHRQQNIADMVKTFTTQGLFARLHCAKQEKQLQKLLSEVAVMDPADMSIEITSQSSSQIRLQQLLSHPFTIEIVKDSLSRALSPENMSFWIDIQMYRSAESPVTRKVLAEEIYNLYITDGATSEVNLSSSMKEGITNKMNRYSTYNQDHAISLFDDAEKEIFKLMQTNNYETIAHSPFFKLAAMVLGHPDYKLRHSTDLNVRGVDFAQVEKKKVTDKRDKLVKTDVPLEPASKVGVRSSTVAPRTAPDKSPNSSYVKIKANPVSNTKPTSTRPPRTSHNTSSVMGTDSVQSEQKVNGVEPSTHSRKNSFSASNRVLSGPVSKPSRLQHPLEDASSRVSKDPLNTSPNSTNATLNTSATTAMGTTPADPVSSGVKGSSPPLTVTINHSELTGANKPIGSRHSNSIVSFSFQTGTIVQSVSSPSARHIGADADVVVPALSPTDEKSVAAATTAGTGSSHRSKTATPLAEPNVPTTLPGMIDI